MSSLRESLRTVLRRLRSDEASNSFALFVVMLPMLMGAFGMGLDMSRNVYIRTELQNALDMATVSGAGVTTITNKSNVKIVEGEAIDAVEKVYAINRANTAPTDCWGDNTPIPGTNLRRCWKVSQGPTITNSRLTYTVRERSKNAFLPVIGINWQRYTITSEAVINQQGE